MVGDEVRGSNGSIVGIPVLGQKDSEKQEVNLPRCLLTKIIYIIKNIKHLNQHMKLVPIA